MIIFGQNILVVQHSVSNILYLIQQSPGPILIK